ncbi:M15 family metallopeptidase [Vibrio hippocampi]|uniref:D-alanyl-D-alanine carboxypeptidase-like core domain-containing protein n=1 Tax=Vibrio hippocampi TaxID=654686 RepID=A0ABM8ZFX7_9VIBR|nr:M15 family metallopeptidase [Vibrio hippocampi]CAH0525001.1 hypothetical protein VHP8226_00668 [Vibrio hippocampi]
MTPAQLVGQDASHLSEVLIGIRSFEVHREVKADLLALEQSARQAGFEFHIASGYRSFERQLAIWNNKMSGVRPILDLHSQPLATEHLSESEKVFAILRWSALPGASRHHWGTDFDLYAHNLLPEGTAIALEPWEYLSGHQTPFYQWLLEHAQQWGFFFPYAQDLGGVSPEPWHLSHKLTAHQCLQLTDPKILQSTLEQTEILGRKTILSELDTLYTQFIANICQ